MKLELEKYYNKKNYNIESYKATQIKRHSLKRDKKRSSKFYSEISEIILSHVNNIESKKMIALGTRNNHEKKCFAKDLNCSVFSADISSSSKADFIFNFNFMPNEWNDKWDIIYSNAIDHAVDPTNIFIEWLKCLKLEGLLVIGFNEGSNPSAHDCCTFSINKVEIFFKNQDNVQILQIKEISGYHHFFLKRIK